MKEEFWFPGRWVGGISMVVAPIMLLMGVVLRMQYHFFFPEQLSAYEQDHELMFAAYSMFLAGNILLWPAIMTLAKLIGDTKQAWAICGGSFVLSGLFARTFHAGIDHMAFQLVDIRSAEFAEEIVGQSYGAYHIISSLSMVILTGWIILAIGAYVSGTLGLLRSIALGLMAGLMIGVLKGTSIVSIICTSGLCIALVPLGFKILLADPRPKLQTVIAWTGLMSVFMIVLYFSGQLG